MGRTSRSGCQRSVRDEPCRQLLQLVASLLREDDERPCHCSVVSHHHTQAIPSLTRDAPDDQQAQNVEVLRTTARAGVPSRRLAVETVVEALIEGCLLSLQRNGASSSDQPSRASSVIGGASSPDRPAALLCCLQAHRHLAQANYEDR